MFVCDCMLKIFTLCPKTGFRLLEKNLNCVSLLCSWTRSPSYLISEYIPLGHFLKKSSKFLHGSA